MSDPIIITTGKTAPAESPENKPDIVEVLEVAKAISDFDKLSEQISILLATSTKIVDSLVAIELKLAALEMGMVSVSDSLSELRSEEIEEPEEIAEAVSEVVGDLITEEIKKEEPSKPEVSAPEVKVVRKRGFF